MPTPGDAQIQALQASIAALSTELSALTSQTKHVGRSADAVHSLAMTSHGAVSVLQNQVNSLPPAAAQAFTASTSTPLSVNLSLGYSVNVTLDANLALSAPTNMPAAGAIISFVFVQDPTGGRTVSWHADFVGSYRFMPRQGGGQISRAVFVSNGGSTMTLVGLDGINTEGELDIRDFGAKDGDLAGVIDHAPIIEAALAAGVTMSGPGRTVVVPDGRWVVRRPVIISSQYGTLKVRGQSKQHSSISQDGYVGPSVLVVPNPSGWAKPTVGAGPLSGTGAWPMDGTNSYWLDFSDSYWLSLNGLTACCFQIWVKPTATTFGYVLRSKGGFKSGSDIFSYNSAFNIYLDGNDGTGKAKVTAHLNVGGTVKTLDPTTGVPLNTWTHVALDYDGTTVRLFLGGVLAKSAAATGNVKQTELEHVVMGPDVTPQGGSDNADMTGSVGPLKIDKASIYTGAFTPPTAKFSLGANTLLFSNFDNESNSYFSIARIQSFQNGSHYTDFDYYIPIRRRDVGQGLGEVEISNLRLGGQNGGLYVFGTAHTSIHDLLVDAYNGIVLENNSFISSVRDCFITSSGGPTATQTNCWKPRYGLFWGGACGYATDNVTITGFMFQFTTLTGGCRVSNLFSNIQADVRCVATLVAYSSVTYGNSASELDNVAIDTEEAAPDFAAAGFFQFIQTLNIACGQWDISDPISGMVNPFTVNECGTINFIGAMVAGGVGVDIVNSVDATTKINAIGSIAAKGITSWSNDAPNTTVIGCIT